MTDHNEEITTEEVIQDTRASGHRVFNGMLKHCALLSLTFSRWRGRITEKQADVKIGEEEMDKAIRTNPCWRLMPDEWNRQFQAVENATRSAMSTLCVNFPIPTLYVIPYQQLKKALEKIGTYQKDYMEKADEFCSESVQAAIRTDLEAKAKTPEIWELMQKALPTPAEMRRTFHLACAVLPVGEAPASFLEDPAEYIQKAREYTEEFIRKTMDGLLQGPQRECVEEIKRIQASLRDPDRRLMRGTFTELTAALSRVASFRQMDPQALGSGLAGIDLNFTTAQIKELNASDNAAAELAARLQSVLQQVDDYSATERILGMFGASE